MTYGVIENAPGFADRSLLPMGIAEGCRLLRDLAKDDVIAYSDVELPKGRVCDQLRAEQAAQFISASPASFKSVVQS
jgi:predicted homoserine dehydrogenase-like protein